MAFNCPCGTGKPFDDCCKAFISGDRFPTTAEELMRSRYTAFVMTDAAYLLRTWHPDTRPTDVAFDKDQAWRGLEIVGSEKGRMLDTAGIVEFIARYVQGGRPDSMRARSEFSRVGGKWFYVDDEQD